MKSISILGYKNLKTKYFQYHVGLKKNTTHNSIRIRIQGMEDRACYIRLTIIFDQEDDD